MEMRRKWEWSFPIETLRVNTVIYAFFKFYRNLICCVLNGHSNQDMNPPLVLNFSVWEATHMWSFCIKHRKTQCTVWSPIGGQRKRGNAVTNTVTCHTSQSDSPKTIVPPLQISVSGKSYTTPLLHCLFNLLSHLRTCCRLVSMGLKN